MRSTRDTIYQYLQLSNYQTIKLPATIKHIIPLIISNIGHFARAGKKYTHKV